jgi:hypothetical protein
VKPHRSATRREPTLSRPQVSSRRARPRVSKVQRPRSDRATSHASAARRLAELSVPAERSRARQPSSKDWAPSIHISVPLI